MDKEEWLKRCAQQFMTVGKLNKHDADYQAGCCYDGMFESFREDPEGCANEEMSYWD